VSRSQKPKIEPHPHPDVELNTDYFTGFVTDGFKLVTSPLHWDSKDWLTAGLIGGTTVALGFLDETVRDEIVDNPSQTRKDFFKIGEIAGDGGYAAGYLSLFYLTGLLRDDEELQSTALLATESFLLSGAFTLTLKHLIGRERPSSTTEADNFSGPFAGEGLSFPSGHTTTAFAIATVFAKQYKRHVWVPPLAYTLATMTALSRVNDNVHWTSDVFFGAAIGYFTAAALHKMHSNPDASRLMVRPMVSSARQGIALDYRF
jgi:membrane-associated phospholipid phosphatase